MSLSPFGSTEEFLGQFDLDTPPPYENVTHLTDRRVGFSVTKLYPSNLRFVPARTSEGRDDTVALIHVVYTHPDESSGPIDLESVPIILSVTSYSLYLRGRLNFNPTDPNSPTEESLRVSRSSWKPIPLDFSGEYIFDHSSETFRDGKGNTLTGRVVLDQVFHKHCDTVHPFRGLRIQAKIKSKNILVKLADLTVSLFLGVLGTIFGRTIDKKPNRVPYLEGYSKEDLKLVSPEKVTLLCYDASRSVIVIFALLVTIVAVIHAILPTSGSFFDRLLSNNLFVVCVTVTSLWFLERVAPLILLSLVNLIIRCRTWLLFQRFRF